MMFPCVPCGRDVELGEKGLTDCLRNLTLERIVERLAAYPHKHICSIKEMQRYAHRNLHSDSDVLGQMHE